MANQTTGITYGNMELNAQAKKIAANMRDLVQRIANLVAALKPQNDELLKMTTELDSQTRELNDLMNPASGKFENKGQ
jgi:hypothetical protein